MCNFGVRRLKPDLCHRLSKQISILSHINGLTRRRNHFDVVFFENALARKIERTVQSRLATHRRQYRVGALLFDDSFDCRPVHGLYIDGICHIRVGHDRGRIRIHQDDTEVFFFERLAGLRAGVVEFARLPDHNRASADD